MSDYIRIGVDHQVTTPPRLIAVFFSIFDIKIGPRLIFEAPEGSLKPLPNSTSLINFSSISDYIIPKPHLCGRLVSICAGSYKVMGVPVEIKDEEKYVRGNFVFNMSFVFDRNADTSSYEPIVRKIARVLASLEVRFGSNKSKSRLLKIFLLEFEKQLILELSVSLRRVTFFLCN
jgi:nitrogen permease regulator 2-like protein